MMYRQLGRTGFGTSALGLGGESALYEHSDAAVRIILRALDLGVNYFDTAPLYQDSELNYGEVLPTRRREMFLATKTDQRDYDGAWRQFENSLRRLKIPRVDLIQIHHLDFPEEVDAAFDTNGVYRMVREAKEQGLTSFIGITGHSDPAVLLSAIERGVSEGAPFDTILMALNPAEVHVHSFQEKLLPRAVELDMGIMAMKVFARSLFARTLGWGAETLLNYVLSLPVSNAVVGMMNEAQLDRDAQIAGSFRLLPEAEMRRLEAEAKPHARELNFYRKGLEGLPFPVPPNMVTEAL